MVGTLEFIADKIKDLFVRLHLGTWSQLDASVGIKRWLTQDVAGRPDGLDPFLSVSRGGEVIEDDLGVVGRVR